MLRHQKVPSKNFVQTLAANVDNKNLDDAAFREFVRNTLPIVDGGEIMIKDSRPVQHVGDVSDIVRREILNAKKSS